MADLKQITDNSKLSSLHSAVWTYIGSKWLLAPFIISLMPRTTMFIEVFGGTAAVLLRKKPDGIEVYNDLDNDLVNLYLVLKNKFSEFMAFADNLPVSRVLFERYCDVLKTELPNEKIGEDVERAVYWGYVNLYGGLGCFPGVFVYGKRKLKTLSSLFYNIREISLRFKNVIIEHLDFEECIKKYDRKDALMYLDPPYYGLEYYDVKFGKDNHIRLFNCLAKTQAKWILSYNAIQDIMDMYKDFYLIKIQYKASYNTAFVSFPRVYNELLICNYRPDNIKESDKVQIIDGLKGKD